MIFDQEFFRWIKKQSTVGANTVLQRQNKLLFSFQKWRLTSVEDSTNARSAAKQVGYKAEDHQLKVCIEKKSIEKK